LAVQRLCNACATAHAHDTGVLRNPAHKVATCAQSCNVCRSGAVTCVNFCWLCSSGAAGARVARGLQFAGMSVLWAVNVRLMSGCPRAVWREEVVSHLRREDDGREDEDANTMLAGCKMPTGVEPPRHRINLGYLLRQLRGPPLGVRPRSSTN
jgi:hypothetical protein